MKRAMLIFAAVVFGLAFAVIGHSQGGPRQTDVPPILEEYGNLGVSFCDMGQCSWVDTNSTTLATPRRRTRFTCADKTRFLMTSEDGVKHCIAY